MKRTFNYAIAVCAALAMGLSSCSKDDATDTNAIPEGKETYMTISLADPAGTYANGDDNATEAETKINTIDVYIFDVAGTLKTHETLKSSDFVRGTGADIAKITATKKIKTTTGPKKIYVGVNLPCGNMGVEGGFDRTQAMDFTDKILVKENITSLETVMSRAMHCYYGSDISEGDVGFSMGSNIINATFEEEAGGVTPAANKISATVKRFVAKVEVIDAFSRDIEGGTLSNVDFRFENVNESMYLAQKVESGFIKDPNWSVYGVDYTNSSFQWRGLYGSGPKYSAYVMENTSRDHKRGESMVLVITASFRPDQFTKKSGNTWVLVPNTDDPMSHPDPLDVYYVNNQGQVAFFEDMATAQVFALEKLGNASKAVECPLGYIRYEAYLGKSQGYNVYRNDYIKATIKSIKGFSLPSGSYNDPIETDTNIDVTIDIEPWNVIADDYDL